MRLIVPFLICWAVLIPPWLWVHSKDLMTECVPTVTYTTINTTTFNPTTNTTAYHISNISNHTTYNTIWHPDPAIPQNIFVFLFKFWIFTEGIFKFDPAWLWFLPVLFLVTVTSMPVMMFGEHKKWMYLLPAIVWLGIQCAIVNILSGYHAFFTFFLGLPVFGTALLVHFVPFPDLRAEPSVLKESARARFVAIQICTLLNIVSSMGCVMNLYYGEMKLVNGEVIPQMLKYPMFYLHGFFLQRWWPEKGSSKQYLSDEEVKTNTGIAVKIVQLAGMLLLFIVIFAGSPVGRWEAKNWPIYSMSFEENSMYAVSYVLGTWAWLGIADGLFQAYAEDVIHETFHKHASNSTIIVYIFHWSFIELFAWFIVRDFDLMHGAWKYVAAVFTWLIGVGCSLGVYYLLLTFPAAGRLLGV